MARTRIGSSILATAFVIVLVACSNGDTQVTRSSGGDETGTTGAATGPSSVPVGGGDDACALLTQDIAEQALGTTLEAGTSAPSAGGGTSCSYFDASNTAGATLVLIPAPGGATAFDAARTGASAPDAVTPFFHDISGLGDQAFTDGLSVYVLSGETYVAVIAFTADQEAGDTSTGEAIASQVVDEL